MDGPCLLVHEETDGLIPIDGAMQTLFKAIEGGVVEFAVVRGMIGHGEPGAERLVELRQGQDVAGAHFGFELLLVGEKEPFDQSARRRIAGLAVEQANE